MWVRQLTHQKLNLFKKACSKKHFESHRILIYANKKEIVFSY
jgi:hypothetical protein